MLYPVLNTSRALIDLSGIWRFRLDDGTGFDQRWCASRWTSYITMAVPASYNDQKQSMELRDHCGWAFYQRDLSIPRVLKDQRLVLRFGAVTQTAKVYLDGDLVAEHKGGFLPFEVELKNLKKVESHLLTVAVDNRVDYSTLPVGSETGAGMMDAGAAAIPGVAARKQNRPNFDFFNYAGIHRPVKLYTTPDSYIRDITLVPRLTGTDAEVDYQIEVAGEGTPVIEVFSESGEKVASAEGPKGCLKIRDVTLWQPLAAYLYTARVKFGDDCYDQPFGVRTVEVRGNRFLINGKPFYFKGFGKHEDADFRGRGLDQVINVKDLALMKWTGANSLRTSHYPYSEEMLDLCDREGIVVIDETPAVGLHLNIGGAKSAQPTDTFATLRTHGHHRDVVEDLIARDKNHPSVVLWCLANESDTATHPEKAYEYFQPLYELARQRDPQKRPVTIVGIMGKAQGDLTLPAMDVICLNRYYGWYVFGGDLKAAQQAMAQEMQYWGSLGKPVMFTEYGADTVAGLHSATPTMFTEEYQVEYLKANHEVFDSLDFFVGEHVWNFADFQTSEGILRVDGNKKGVFSRDRRPKMAAHYLRERWGKVPDFGYKG